jgi:hypothetical protein
MLVYCPSEFEVESARFPGHVHRWRLSQVLQKGSEHTNEALWDDLSLALSFIVIKARDCFLSSSGISVKTSLTCLGQGILTLLGKTYQKLKIK